MNLRDYIGKRWENLFRVIITEFCDGRPWFDVKFEGDKHQTTDFAVELIEPTSGGALFSVQVKATTSRYSGTGSKRKLNVQVSKNDVEKLAGLPWPAYIVGIDIEEASGYLFDPSKSNGRGISGIPTANLIDCGLLKALWLEVDLYWTARKTGP